MFQPGKQILNYFKLIILCSTLENAMYFHNKSYNKKNVVLCFSVKKIICQSLQNKKLYNCENGSYLQIGQGVM